jgi:hypothetical protein
MNAFEQARVRAREEYAKQLGCFAPVPGTMRRIADHAELEQLRAAGVGFIVNVRDDTAKVHRVHCEAVEVMSTSKYAKIFSPAAEDVVQWLNSHPEGTSDNCGLCGGCSP